MPHFPKTLPHRARRGIRPLLGGVGVLAVAVALVLAAPSAALADQAITSAGPLTNVRITPDLNCAVDYAGDTHGEFYSDTACGTFVAFNDGSTRLLAGPASVPAGASAVDPGIPFVPVSQSRAGSGTRADPHSITTTVRARNAAGAGILELTQVDSYVVGDNFYATSTSVRALDGPDHDITLYHGADCYLGGDDKGYGDYSATTGAVTCKASIGASSRIEQFIPRTPGSAYYYGTYAAMWVSIGSKAPLPNTLNGAASAQDNGIALSWNLHVPAAGSASASMLTNFSPVDLRALPTTLTPESSSVPARTSVAFRAAVSNAANTTPVMMEALTVQLPSGAEYVEDSLSGASGRPSQTGDMLTIPLAREIAGGASTSVGFRVAFAEQGAARFALSGSAFLAPVLDSSTTVMVTAPLVNAAASDDTASTAYATAVTIPVLTNDVGDGIAASTVGTSADGTVTLNADGTVTFAPRAGFAGEASFNYAIVDVRGNRAQATVVVMVAEPDAPVAVDDAVSTGYVTAVTVPVLVNDSGAGVSVSAVGTSPDGTVTLNADGTVTFVPRAGFAGEASFGYTIVDARGAQAQADLVVTVEPPAAPVAVDDAVSTPYASSVTIPVLTNDDGTDLAVVAVDECAEGTVTVNTDGTVTFAPTSAFAGEASFDYTVEDAVAQRATATVTVTVDAPTAPAATDDAARTASGTEAIILVLDNDSGEAIVVAEVETPEGGTVVLNDDGTVRFTPDSEFAGTATFDYTIEDAVGQRDTATVTVSVEAVAAVVVEADAPPRSLAVTGSTVAIGLGVAAVVSLVAGLVLLGLRRRRADQV